MFSCDINYTYLVSLVMKNNNYYNKKSFMPVNFLEICY